MAPIKFEEHIKDTLEKRTVTPSAGAWSQLSQRLEADETQNKKPLFWWFGIAASIAALAFVSIMNFNTTNEEPTIENTIVEQQTEDVINVKPSKISLLKEAKQVAKSDGKTTIEDQKQPTKLQLIPSKKNTVIVPERETELVSAEKVEIKTKPRKEVTDEEITKLLNEAKFKSVVAELQKVKEETNATVTYREIDSLLKMASRGLFKVRVPLKETIIADADVLLQLVEDEVDQSLTSRIYEALRSGLKDVKVAVAIRNN
jgi:hypothetical protein